MPNGLYDRVMGIVPPVQMPARQQRWDFPNHDSLAPYLGPGRTEEGYFEENQMSPNYFRLWNQRNTQEATLPGNHAPRLWHDGGPLSPEEMHNPSRAVPMPEYQFLPQEQHQLFKLRPDFFQA